MGLTRSAQPVTSLESQLWEAGCESGPQHCCSKGRTGLAMCVVPLPSCAISQSAVGQSRASASPSPPVDRVHMHFCFWGRGGGEESTALRLRRGTASCSPDGSCRECDLDAEPLALPRSRQGAELDEPRGAQETGGPLAPGPTMVAGDGGPLAPGPTTEEKGVS